MILGVPKEIKEGEGRVALVPRGVEKLVSLKHRTLVERGAGEKAGIHDVEYIKAGAEIILHHERIFKEADVILKVKEPLPEEYALLREGQLTLQLLLVHMWW